MKIKHHNAANSITSRYIYMQNGQVLLDAEKNWLQSEALELSHSDGQQAPLLVASLGKEDIYLHTVCGSEPWQHEVVHGRELMARLSVVEVDLLSRALQLSHWLKDHQFCGRCGGKTQLHHQDYGLHCSSCEHTQYPRISPCIIVVVKGPKGILLAHNTRFPEGRYSALAGFVEAGETVEAAVHREVFEEVGVKLGKINYLYSQSWSFPHSLMMGFLAEYESGEIEVDGVEIDEADWFLPSNLPDLPPNFSIARQLIDTALAEY